MVKQTGFSKIDPALFSYVYFPFVSFCNVVFERFLPDQLPEWIVRLLVPHRQNIHFVYEINPSRSNCRACSAPVVIR